MLWGGVGTGWGRGGEEGEEEKEEEGEGGERGEDGEGGENKDDKEEDEEKKQQTWPDLPEPTAAPMAKPSPLKIPAATRPRPCASPGMPRAL